MRLITARNIRKVNHELYISKRLLRCFLAMICTVFTQAEQSRANLWCGFKIIYFYQKGNCGYNFSVTIRRTRAKEQIAIQVIVMRAMLPDGVPWGTATERGFSPVLE